MGPWLMLLKICSSGLPSCVRMMSNAWASGNGGTSSYKRAREKLGLGQVPCPGQGPKMPACPSQRTPDVWVSGHGAQTPLERLGSERKLQRLDVGELRPVWGLGRTDPPVRTTLWLLDIQS